MMKEQWQAVAWPRDSGHLCVSAVLCTLLFPNGTQVCLINKSITNKSLIIISLVQNNFLQSSIISSIFCVLFLFALPLTLSRLQVMSWFAPGNIPRYFISQKKKKKPQLLRTVCRPSSITNVCTSAGGAARKTASGSRMVRPIPTPETS